MNELPIIIYTGKELTQEEETRLRKYAETIIVKDVKSPERLLDETALFLHRVEASCRSRSGDARAVCTTPTPCSPARTSWSSTTTCGTSSR